MSCVLTVETAIYPRPNELADATPFPQDEAHASYDGDAARRCWRRSLNKLKDFISRYEPVRAFFGHHSQGPRPFAW